MADWYRDEETRRSRGYGEDYDYGHHGRSSGRDRGMFERGADEVRSWFGDDEAEQRRRRDMSPREREYREMSSREREYREPGTSGRGFEQRGRDFGYSGTRVPEESRSSPYWRDMSSDEADFEPTGIRSRLQGRSMRSQMPATFSYTEIWMIPGPFSGQGPRGYQRSDDRIREDVCERLTQHGQIDAREIDVAVANGEVTLRGAVDDRRTKRLAEDTVESIPGVRDVKNELRVSRGGMSDQQEQGRLQQGQSTPTTGGQTRQERTRAST